MLVAISSLQIEPQWDGESKVASHLLFCHGARCRRGLPYDLVHEVEDIRRKGEEVEEVSIGLDGDWFLRTNSLHGNVPSHIQAPHSHQSHVSLAKTRNML
jgi:hypothetical protein